MARRNIAGIFKSAVLGAALVGGFALSAQAQDPGDQAITPFGGGGNQLELSATTTFTTDYVFRGISQTNQNPAAQAEFDATYGMFYLGMWGSNVDFDPALEDSIEIDYYGGITPTWAGIDFDIGALWYTYPGKNGTDIVEIKTGGSYTFGESFTLGVTNYWGTDSDYDVLEIGGEYAFANKWFNFFDPSISGVVGFQWADAGTDYTYWNVGLTLGFLDNWSADVRYWDTDLSDAACGFTDVCDSRVVGTLSASF